jgi:WD40 repeat protein
MGRVNVLAWSPNGTQLAVGSEDGDIRVWDITSGEMYITDYQVDAGGIQALDYSPDGRYLAAGTGANLVHVWALTDDAVLISGSYEHGPSSIPGEGNPGGITAVAWSPDSSTLASAGYDAQIKLFPVVGDVRTLRQGGWFATSLHWFADSIHLLAGEHNPEIWNTVSGEQLPIPCANDPQLVLALSPDEHYLLLDEGEGPYYLCDIFTGEQSPTISLNILDWNPVYPVVAAVDSTTHKITLFDPPTFGATTTEAIAVIPMVTQVQTAAWSPDGRYLAIGLADGTVQLFALQEYRTG